MNYITSCPECSTQFFLNTEHLKAHRGKVQCGNCNHVFNAKNRLTEISDDIHSTEEYQASLEQHDEEVAFDEVENDAPQTSPIEPTFNVEAVSSDITLEVNSDIRSPIVIEDLSADPKFAKKPTKPNVALIMLSLCLILVAAIQTIYFMRSKIAADYPQFKPMMVQACKKLGCQIPLARHLDLLVIDDSDMQEDEKYQSVINFSSLLINNAGFIQAFPNIELTLTNTEDQPVLRKIIKPEMYLGADRKIDDGIKAHEEIRIKLAINTSGIPAAGYRILLVY